MSFLKGFIDSLGEAFSSVYASDDQLAKPSKPSMDGDGNRVLVSNEKTAYKLKGYFDLAKEEIAKAVRAEEWGLIDDAVSHYMNAQQILVEAMEIRAPSCVYASASEVEKVNFYHRKVSEWQGKVSERLRLLSRRDGSQVGASTANKVVAKRSQPATTSSTVVDTQKYISRTPNLPSRNDSFKRSSTNNVGSSRPAQDSSSSCDPKLVEMINTVIVDRSPSVKWEDVGGLDKAKQSLMEMVILPTKRKDLFTGLRRPARGLLLFGPPGNGKTMLAKAVASESEATFFNVGEAEKLVRTLFMVAISRQPSVIFMDEIDSIMSARSANENDSSRRLKSEFLVQFDGVSSNSNDLVIVIGATNRPQDLDDAVLRRLVKRIYIPLPDENVRRLILKNKLKGQAFSLPGRDLEKLVQETEGYSGSDLQALCEEAAMAPIRELGQKILTVKADQVRPLKYADFQKAMTIIRPSLQKSKWEELERWNKEFGSYGFPNSRFMEYEVDSLGRAITEAARYKLSPSLQYVTEVFR
ncbi:hypothetical protein Scep_006372 [Stephania cephalantha]|uniref:microtubule-severing ATPase n=1 Tax=Stephania cephalantha TaxID=152367 RepID=A0AAP0KAK2_9MAGN